MDLYGFDYRPGYFDRTTQEALVDDIRKIVIAAPLYTPVMPGNGRPMRVRMTNCGKLGWVSDKDQGYSYQPTHPITGQSWPQMPARLLQLWGELTGFSKSPEACLINFYGPEARMGLHQDKDEAEIYAPIVSVSLGCSCLFRIGGLARTDKTHSIKLESGDVIMFGGKMRMAYHGVDRIYPGSSTLLRSPGRINLTLRRVTI